MNDSLVFTLAKVVVATAWADGEVSLDEINAMKDLLFRLPDLTQMDWERLEMYIETPVSDDERQRLVSELRAKVRTNEDKQLIEQAMEAIVQADGELSEDEREVFAEVIDQVGSVDTGVFGSLNRLLRPARSRRSQALSGAPNRETQFDDYINNRVYYELQVRLSNNGMEFNINDSELRRLSLAGGLLSRVARVDRVVSQEELSQISAAAQRGWDLNEAEANLVAEVAVSDMSEDLDYLRLCWNLFDVTTADERLRLTDALFEVAAADGRVTNEEIEEIRGISNSLKLTHKEFIDAKLKVPREIRDS